MRAQDVRLVDPGCDLDELFLFEQKRKVQKDRTVSLDGVAYEVDASLVGETVTLRLRPLAAVAVPSTSTSAAQGPPGEGRRPLRQLLRPPRPRTKALQPDRRLDVPPPGLRLREPRQGAD